MPRRRVARKPRRRVARKPRRGMRKGSGDIKTKHYARIVEAINVSDPTAVAGVADVNYSFTLADFSRAKAVASNFKYFRAKRCVWKYIPMYNTYQGQISDSLQVPQIQFIMNRTGDITLWTQAEYDAQGASPVTFTKTRTVAYKPNLVQVIQQIPQNFAISPSPDQVGTGSADTFALGSVAKYDMWLATTLFPIQQSAPYSTYGVDISNSANMARYHGHSMFFNAPGTSDDAHIARVYLEVEWEFKDPLFQAVVQAPAPEQPSV